MLSPLAGLQAPPSLLVNVPKLITAYYSEIPDAHVAEQRVIFGTSGHRGSSLDKSFNEWHILAITQAICLYRAQHNINGPLFLGIDTHALSMPAFVSALEVLAANKVEVMIAKDDEYTPTPVISHAILTYNHERSTGLADGIVVTPSHNPPQDGGFKYNPPSGGPADQNITQWIEKTANEFLKAQLKDIKRISFEHALRAATTHRYDYLNTYVNDLKNIVDVNLIRDANVHMGVDPLGGAGVHYWQPIADKYGLNLKITNETVDPTFSFMTVDWDGQIRMDPSSPYAMASLLKLKNNFDIAFACDTDYDRHGIVTPSKGLLPPNHYLCLAILYLFQQRKQWNPSAAIGKTIVSSQMIDRVTTKLGRRLYEVPVGFKWFVDGLLDSSLGFGGEESAGASFSRMSGHVWTSDKDGIILALLSAEMTAHYGRDIAQIYDDLAHELGPSVFDRIDAPATSAQKTILGKLTANQIHSTELAGEKIQSIITKAPGNDAPIGGVKVMTASGWFAARPSGTEDIYRVYAESFQDTDHLKRIITEAQTIIDEALTTAGKNHD
jgi:phosphoglucomutase